MQEVLGSSQFPPIRDCPLFTVNQFWKIARKLTIPEIAEKKREQALAPVPIESRPLGRVS